MLNRILHMLDKRTRLAFFNGSVPPHLDFADTVWGKKPGLKSDMQQLQAFQESDCQVDRRCQFVVSRGPDIVEMASASWKALRTSMSCCPECDQGRCSKTF